MKTYFLMRTIPRKAYFLKGVLTCLGDKTQSLFLKITCLGEVLLRGVG